MVECKSIETTKRNWEASHPRVGAAYKAGIATSKEWKSAAIAGQQNYEEKMRDETVLARRQRRIEETSEDTWKSGALNKGAANIARGMEAAKGKYGSRMGGVIDQIKATNLPDRTTDPMTNVTNRCGGMAVSLSEWKKNR